MSSPNPQDGRPPTRSQIPRENFKRPAHQHPPSELSPLRTPAAFRPEEYSRPFIRDHLRARESSPPHQSPEMLLELYERFSEVAQRLSLLDRSASLLPFHALLETQGTCGHFHELLVMRSNGRLQIRLCETRDTNITIVRDPASTLFDSSAEDVEPRFPIIREDHRSGTLFAPSRSAKEVVIGFAFEGRSLRGGTLLNDQCVFAVTDGVVTALSIDFPSLDLTLGPPSLEAFGPHSIEAPTQTLSDVDADLVLSHGTRLLAWAEEAISEES